MKQKILSLFFLLSVFQTLVSCATSSSESHGEKLNKASAPPAKNIEKPALKESSLASTNVFNYSYPKKEGESEG